MRYDLRDAISLLRRTPAVLDALLRDLPDIWTLRNEGADTWSPYDVLGHLIHAERTAWMPRAKMILEHGQTKAFEPFDRTAQLRHTDRKSLTELLEEFAQLRSENLTTLEALRLKPDDLERRGRHPTLGLVMLAELRATWAAHD